MSNLMPLAHAEPSSHIQHELDALTPLAQCRGLDIYQFHADQAPVTMNEVGRLRELVFRHAGAGRNLPRDTDALDFSANGYRQLIVWDAKRQQLVALYRFKHGSEVADDLSALRTSQLFDYTAHFTTTVMPLGIELGRSVVNPQATASRFGFFALWTGLQALLEQSPATRFFFGNVSLYQGLGAPALELIISFCQQYYSPPQSMLAAKQALRFHTTTEHQIDASATPRQRIHALQALLNPLDVRIPKILQSYLSLSGDIWFDDAAWDADFGAACELSIIVPVRSIRSELTSKLSVKGVSSHD